MRAISRLNRGIFQMQRMIVLGISLVVVSVAICDSAQAGERGQCRKKMGWTNEYASTITSKSNPALYMAFQDCVAKLAAAKKH
jgi:hypothetical protein